MKNGIKILVITLLGLGLPTITVSMSRRDVQNAYYNPGVTKESEEKTSPEDVSTVEPDMEPTPLPRSIPTAIKENNDSISSTQTTNLQIIDKVNRMIENASKQPTIQKQKELLTQAQIELRNINIQENPAHQVSDKVREENESILNRQRGIETVINFRLNKLESTSPSATTPNKTDIQSAQTPQNGAVATQILDTAREIFKNLDKLDSDITKLIIHPIQNNAEASHTRIIGAIPITQIQELKTRGDSLLNNLETLLTKGPKLPTNVDPQTLTNLQTIFFDTWNRLKNLLDALNGAITKLSTSQFHKAHNISQLPAIIGENGLMVPLVKMSGMLTQFAQLETQKNPSIKIFSLITPDRQKEQMALIPKLENTSKQYIGNAGTYSNFTKGVVLTSVGCVVAGAAALICYFNPNAAN